MKIRDDLKEVPEIIRSVRPMLLPYFGNILMLAKEGREHDVITELDAKVENYLKEKFAEAAPDIDFFGEEMGGNRSSRFWLVDPIDGTLCFARGIPFCTTMVALIEDGKVTFSAIYNFVNDALFMAEKGKGSWENDRQIHVSDRALYGSLVKLESNRRLKEYDAFKELLWHEAIPFDTPSSGFEFCLVASGVIDARVCLTPYGKDYDFAPGSLLVSEAGGIVRNIGKESYDYQNTDLIAANPKVYEEIKKLLN